MTSRIWLSALTMLLLSLTGTALAAITQLNSTIKRVYVSNSALSIVAGTHPAGCPYGIVASDLDPAYDRWISLSMLAFERQYATVIEYDPTTCKLNSLAISVP